MTTTDPTGPCLHDTIADAAGLRVCLDCGTPHPQRHRDRGHTEETPGDLIR